MPRRLHLVLGDQLSPGLSSLADLGPDDRVVMAEVIEEATYVRHHKQKLALVFAAMRHFADCLRRRGVRVEYREFDADDGCRSLLDAVADTARRHDAERVVVTEPGEWRLWSQMRTWEKTLGVPVEIRPDDRFFCSRDDFVRWAKGRRSLRMEYFYRDMRRRTGLLMELDGEPAGGRWNFDTENRKPLDPDVALPARRRPEPDALTRRVMATVAEHFGHPFGDLEPFGHPVTRDAAEAALSDFLREELPRFGDFQDAMRAGEPFLYHSLLSSALNLGLLDPRAVCAAAEQAWRNGQAPLNAVEGFIRQILGWREFVRGIYWWRMPDYPRSNHLDAERLLPAFYWTGETDLRCLADCVATTRRYAYAHHIQRLMVTGNFALIAGIAPAAVNHWYLVVYADAFEWVQLPNTHGMSLFADGGLLASKPYAASGKYIDRMSDYCSGCRYDVRKSTGADACPFNFLYWDFVARNARHFERNPRMAMPLKTLGRLDPGRLKQMRSQATGFLDGLDYAEEGAW